MRGFVFAVVFIVVFATLLASIPAGLQGSNVDPETVIPIDPSIISGFSESENYTAASFYAATGSYWYEYNMGNRDWLAATDDATAVQLAAKELVFGIFWFGQIHICEFRTSDGVDRGTAISFDEIDTDSQDGVIRYSLSFTDIGDNAGALVVYWNVTEYASVSDAWAADKVYLLHGVGFESTATANIGALLVSLLFLQIPEVPALVNVFIVVPLWACIIYVLWFVIKEMIPFV